MVGFSDDDVHRVRVALGKIARRVDRGAADEGLTRTQFAMLSTVARRGPLGVGELAEIEGLNPTMLSRLVGKMSDAGLLERASGTRDKRVVTVRATAEGRTLYLRLRDKRAAVLAEHLGGLEGVDAAALLAALPALEALAESLPAAGTRP